MCVGILGSGWMGCKLGTSLARTGFEVVFSYARSEPKFQRLARDAQGQTRAGTPRAVRRSWTTIRKRWRTTADLPLLSIQTLSSHRSPTPGSSG
jgi:hypothetical protein